MHSLFNRKKVEGKTMLVRRAEIKDMCENKRIVIAGSYGTPLWQT